MQNLSSVEILSKLIKYKSLTPNDDGAYDFIDEYMGSEWQCIAVDKGGVKNRFYYKDFRDDKQKTNKNFTHFCFGGHIDVVNIGEGWSFDAFSGEIKDGYMLGRGAQDMKAGLACFMYALKHTKEFDGMLSMLITSDEEGDAKYGTKIMLEHLKEIDMLPNYALIAEPTSVDCFGDGFKIGRRGSIHGSLEIIGKQGHSAYPHLAINPVDLLSCALSNIAGAKLDDGDEFFSPSTLVVTNLNAGLGSSNVSPGELKMTFNVRNCTISDDKSVYDFVYKALIDGGVSEDSFKLEVKAHSKPFLTNKDSLLVAKTKKAIEHITNKPTDANTKGGTSDARFFAPYGIDVVEFGVRNNYIHKVDERVCVDDVVGLNDVFRYLIDNFN